MKKLTFLLFFIISVNYAQNKQLLYGFAELPQTLMLNPGAEIDNKFYVGFPLFSQASVQGGFTGFSTYDIFRADNIDINSKIANAIQNFGNTEIAQANQQVEVFSGGFKWNESTYISFGFYQEFDFLAKIPKDITDLVYDGNTTLNRSYGVEKLSARIELLGVAHAGISKKINEKWQVGGRLKLYSSVFNGKSKSNTGALYTKKGEDNRYLQRLSNVDILLQTSGLLTDVDITPSYLAKNLLFSGNFGLGFDVGFTYHIDKQWTVTGSALDIGFVYNTQNIESYTIKGDFETEGIDLIFNPTDDPSDYWNNIRDEFDDSIVIDTIYKKYISVRPLKLNTSLYYSFGEKYDRCRFDLRPGQYSNKAGVQLFATLGTVHSYMAATLFFERWFGKHFQAKISYTADPYSFSNLGLGASAQFGPFNLYVLADNLLYLNNLYAAKSASVQVGINFIFYDKY